MQYSYKYQSPLGGITMVSDGENLTGLLFDGQKYFNNVLLPGYREQFVPVFKDVAVWLDIYFGGGIPDFVPPIELNGTPFRLAVWDIMSRIPYGSTVTYKEIAQNLALKTGVPKMSSQAIGGAVAHNPVLIILPCHRVIASDGSLCGYAGGEDKKADLLALEKMNIKEI